ncbi:hypothetical protein MMC24_004719 [Lignoscripta atroalba]|nr:hypothetical protein [Lignoscripta atroalba]
MRSPVSPYGHPSKQSFSSQRPCYPSTPLPESLSASQSSNRGLGLFACSLPPSQSRISQLPPSPQASENWSHPGMMEQDYAHSSQPPDIFSAAFDPFSGFSTASNTGMISVHSPEAPGLEYCQTPPNSNIQSHRSSISSSYAPSEAYSRSGSEYGYTPKVKTEDSEWYPSAGNDHILQRGISSQGLPSYPNGSSTLTPQTEDLYRAHASDWSKANTTGYIAEIQAGSESRLPRFEVQPILPSATRIKKKRQRTTPEEATHECRVCGKLFKRSYNWKSHMETHNPERKYPHPCTSMSGSTPCSKKFQRRTDLERHIDSVHLKARNHKCDLCGHRFARRDTLRRHTEDGCSKRLELGIREASVATPARWSFSNFPARTRSYSVGVPHPSPMAAPSSALSSATFPMFGRPEYPGAGHPSATHSPSIFRS